MATTMHGGNPRARLAAERRFYFAMTLAIAALIVWGFAPSFYLRGVIHPTPGSYLDDVTAPVRSLVIVHAAAFTSWLALLIAQSGLVSTGNVAMHRRLGLAAFALVPVMLILGVWMALYSARYGFHDIPMPNATFLAVPLFGMVAFGSLTGTALAQRRRPQTHKRLMVLGTLALAGAGSGRVTLFHEIFPPWFDPTVLLLLPMLWWDWRTLGRIHRATLWGGLLIIVTAMGAVPIGMTPQWLELVRPITG
jgi:hypothetical protein